jgi:tRNA U55 pseudouridine synthase TruB
VVSTADIGGVGEQDVMAAFARFRGTIEQVPPMVSALKRDGTPLYVLARRGEVVEREARSVEVRTLNLLAFDPPRVEFEVACSRGTYVRTLASDVGDALGCGAHLERLRRTRIGHFGLKDASTLEEIERLGEGVAGAGMSMFEALPAMPVVLVGGREEETISTGGAVAFDGEGAREGDLVRVTVDGSELLAVGRVTLSGGARRIQPVRVFAELG